MHSKSIVTVVVALGAVASIAFAAVRRSNMQSAAVVDSSPRPAAVRRTLPDGLIATGRVIVSSVLLDPSSHAEVVVVAAQLDVALKRRAVLQANELVVMPKNGTTAIQWTCEGVNPAGADPTLVGQVAPRNWRFEVRPLAGLDWSSVKSTAHFELTATEF
jgi:hypothetical protein